MRREKQKLALIAAAALLLSGCAKPAAVKPLQKEQKQEETVKKGRENTEEPRPDKVSFAVDDYQSWNQLLEENQISKEFKESLTKFAFQTGIQLLGQEKKNANYSPLSLYYALALAGCGAEGESAAEVLSLLGMSDQEELASQCKKLYQTFYYDEQRRKEQYEEYGEGELKSTIKIGNSLWISNKFSVKNEYRELAAQNFFAPAYLVDFSRSETGQQMGKWISEHTNGVLEPVLTTDSSTVLSILNTLYFYGGWSSSFDKSATKKDTFTLQDGSTTDCLFLNKTEAQGSFKKTDGCTLSRLTTNNYCQMVFLLPDKGRDIQDFLASSEQLEELMNSEEGWTRGKVIWKVPKFSFGSSFQLADTMKYLGLEHIFDLQTANFERISLEKPLYVSDIIQETHIGIDEQGVEGAAYTMIAMAEGTAMITPEQYAEMILDRPFLYGIQDIESGAWLFLGICLDPAKKS